MAVQDDGKGSKFSRIPPPVLDMLGNPQHVVFMIDGRKVTVVAGGKK